MWRERAYALHKFLIPVTPFRHSGELVVPQNAQCVTPAGGFPDTRPPLLPPPPPVLPFDRPFELLPFPPRPPVVAAGAVDWLLLENKVSDDDDGSCCCCCCDVKLLKRCVEDGRGAAKESNVFGYILSPRLSTICSC